jgi:hypothetical protein
MKKLEFKELKKEELKNVKCGFKAGSDLSDTIQDGGSSGGGNDDSDGDGLDDNIGGEYHW